MMKMIDYSNYPVIRTVISYHNDRCFWPKWPFYDSYYHFYHQNDRCPTKIPVLADIKITGHNRYPSSKLPVFEKTNMLNSFILPVIHFISKYSFGHYRQYSLLFWLNLNVKRSFERPHEPFDTDRFGTPELEKFFQEPLIGPSSKISRH